MSGELLIQSDGWKKALPALALSCLLAGGVTMIWARYIHLEGLARGALIALGAYVLFRVLYPACTKLLGAKEKQGPGTWTVTEDTLYLNETAVPRSSIKMVHCWPNRDALGHAGTGWTVNIETTGKNHLLRSLAEGPDADRSARQLRAMVIALGYGAQWRES